MWRTIGRSVIGASHVGNGTECQDACGYQLYSVEGENVLVAAVSDGAGSASHSKVASDLAVTTVLQKVATLGLHPKDFSQESAAQIFGLVRTALTDQAVTEQVEPRELSCTLLFAFVSRSASCFCQVGDGCIVIKTGDTYEAATWPTKGEYANQTVFLVSPKWADAFQFKSKTEPVDSVVLFSDGLEGLILVDSTQSVHGAFLNPLLGALNQAEDYTSLLVPMEAFLSSKAINDRTDDDKTLILASWKP